MNRLPTNALFSVVLLAALVAGFGSACGGAKQTVQTESVSPTPTLPCDPPRGNALYVKRPHASLKGTINDADTGSPLAGARIVLQGQDEWPCTITDADGNYDFGRDAYFTPKAGSFNFEIDAPGYGMTTFVRDLDYLDNPDAASDSPDNWEIQDFPIAKNENVYRDEQQHFSITFPQGWEFSSVASREVNESVFWGKSPEVHTFRSPICEVRSDPLDPGMTPEDYWSAWSDGERPFEVLDRTPAEIAGIPATRIIFMSGREDKYQDKGLAYIFARGQQGWFVDCIDRATTFEDELPTYEGIAQSLTFDTR